MGYLRCTETSAFHDDDIKWKHFPRYWPFVWGIHRSPETSPHKGHWRGALIFSLICVWINGWVNNREAGDLRRYRSHYDVSVMLGVYSSLQPFWCRHLTLLSKRRHVVTWKQFLQYLPFVRGIHQWLVEMITMKRNLTLTISLLLKLLIITMIKTSTQNYITKWFQKQQHHKTHNILKEFSSFGEFIRSSSFTIGCNISKYTWVPGTYKTQELPCHCGPGPHMFKVYSR